MTSNMCRLSVKMKEERKDEKSSKMVMNLTDIRWKLAQQIWILEQLDNLCLMTWEVWILVREQVRHKLGSWSALETMWRILVQD